MIVLLLFVSPAYVAICNLSLCQNGNNDFCSKFYCAKITMFYVFQLYTDNHHEGCVNKTNVINSVWEERVCTYPSGNSLGSLGMVEGMTEASVTLGPTPVREPPRSREIRLMTICPLTLSLSSLLFLWRSRRWTVTEMSEGRC